MIQTRKTFLLSEKQCEMMEELKKKIGVNPDKTIFDMALSNFYNATFKYGTDPLSGGSSPDGDIESQATRKVKFKIAEEKAKEDLKLAPKIVICEQKLKGTVEEKDGGKKICRWNNYSTLRGPEEQSIPLSQVGEYLLSSLFIPDRESVLKEYPELESKFKE